MERVKVNHILNIPRSPPPPHPKLPLPPKATAAAMKKTKSRPPPPPTSMAMKKQAPGLAKPTGISKTGMYFIY